MIVNITNFLKVVEKKKFINVLNTYCMHNLGLHLLIMTIKFTIQNNNKQPYECTII